MMYARIGKGNAKTENPQRHDDMFQVMLAYNSKQKHSSTSKAPEDAQKDTQQADVKANPEIRTL